MSSEASRAEGGGPEGPDVPGRDDDVGPPFHRGGHLLIAGSLPRPRRPSERSEEAEE